MLIRELLELKISYIKHRLAQLPRGIINLHRGKPVISLSYDPLNKEITSSNRRRVVCDSKEGKLLLPLIEESEKLTVKLQDLSSTWKINFKKPPREIYFPLQKKNSTLLTKEFFFSSKPGQNSLDNSRNIIFKGQRLRSKNELLVCQALDSLGYEIKTEIEISPDEFTTFYPDITFYIPEIEKTIAMEIDGAMDKDGYYKKSNIRKNNYLDAGFKEFRDVIFLRLNDSYSFDTEQLEALITSAIIFNLKDIIFPC